MRPDPTRLLVRLFVAALGILTMIAIPAAPASAHAQLTGTNPRDGAVLKTAPTFVTLSFGEELNPTAVQIAVTDSHGKRVKSKPAQVLGSGVRQEVTLPGPGKYTVAYRVISADGHPVQGAIGFTVAGGKPTPTAAGGTPVPTAGAGRTPSASPDPATTVSPTSTPGTDATTPVARKAQSAGKTDSEDSPVWQWIVIGAVLAVLAAIAVALATGGRSRPKS